MFEIRVLELKGAGNLAVVSQQAVLSIFRHGEEIKSDGPVIEGCAGLPESLCEGGK